MTVVERSDFYVSIAAQGKQLHQHKSHKRKNDLMAITVFFVKVICFIASRCGCIVVGRRAYICRCRSYVYC